MPLSLSCTGYFEQVLQVFASSQKFATVLQWVILTLLTSVLGVNVNTLIPMFVRWQQ